MNWVQTAPVTAEAGKSAWTTGETLTIQQNEKILRKVTVFIESAAGDRVRVKITKDGTSLIPASGMVTTSSNDLGYINMSGYPITMEVNTEVKKSQTVEVQYQNLDSTDAHSLLVIFEFSNLPVERASLR